VKPGLPWENFLQRWILRFNVHRPAAGHENPSDLDIGA
jgi:hypothetical protein